MNHQIIKKIEDSVFMDSFIVKGLDESDIDEVFDLVESCYTKDFYEIDERSRSLYYSVLSCGCSIGIYDGSVLIGILIINRKGLSGLGRTPDRLKGFDSSEAFEFMSSCVRKEYRGSHLESGMVNFAIRNIANTGWSWCTVHKDNIPSIKCVTSNGFMLAEGNLTFIYPHKTIHNRNLYYRLN